jgi:hypothetical protein
MKRNVFGVAAVLGALLFVASPNAGGRRRAAPFAC